MREHDAYSVMIGIFHNLEVSGKKYDCDLNVWSEFFGNNGKDYSVLSQIRFDKDRGISSEVYEARGVLEQGAVRMMSSPKNGGIRNFYLINGPFVECSFEKFYKRKFNDFEKKELEDLARDFEDEFLLKGN